MKHFVIKLVFAVLLWQSATLASEDDFVVTTRNGKIRGWKRENFIAFEGVRYAEPPIGNNRFEPPKPYEEHWEGIRDFKKVGHRCLQWDQFLQKGGPDLLDGNEDCLFLNIYTPSLEADHKYPVIITIHGGAFMFGSGDEMGPKHLMANSQFVYVNLNYRLGPLGFLSTEDNAIPGNMGLKDQAMAIKWVKENIHLFNGDPEEIALVGFSAGSASVHYHLLSQEPDNLFKVAISHSGSSLNRWAMSKNSRQKAQKMGELLGCPTENTEELKTCLKATNGDDIVRNVKHFQKFFYTPCVVFSPVVEPKGTENAFITEHPEEILKSGKFKTNIPWILGISKDEGGYNAGLFKGKNENGVEIIEDVERIWNELSPLLFFYNDTSSEDKKLEVTKQIREHYLQEKPFNKENFPIVQKMLTDGMFHSGFEKALKLHAANSEAPVFSYFYTRSSPLASGNLLAKRTDYDFGGDHGNDIYLIYEGAVRPDSTISEEDKKVRNNFINLYQTFIATKQPKYGNLNLEPMEPKGEDLTLLEINASGDAKSIKVHNIGDSEFWKNIS